MKIIVKSGEHDIRLGIPTALIFSKGSAFLAEKLGRKYSPESMVDIPPEAIPALCAELRKIKRSMAPMSWWKWNPPMGGM